PSAGNRVRTRVRHRRTTFTISYSCATFSNATHLFVHCITQGALRILDARQSPWADALPTGRDSSLPTASAPRLPSRYSLAATPQGGGHAQTSARIRHQYSRLRDGLGRRRRVW